MRAAHYVVLIVLVLGLLVSPRQGSAAIVVLSIDESTSTLTLGSDFTVAGFGDFTATEQSAGSLVASYSGTMTIEVDDIFNPTSINFLSGNIVASVMGDYEPADGGDSFDAAPGNYGTSVAGLDAQGKVRNLEFGIGGTATSVDAGDFSSSSQTFIATNGTLDVRSASLNDGNSVEVSGEDDNAGAIDGTYLINGTQLTVTLPVNFSLEFTIEGTPLVTGTNTFSGTFAGVSAVPEPSAMGACMLAILGLTLRRRR